MIGYDEQELLGRSPVEFIDQDSMKKFQEQSSKRATTHYRNYELAFIRKNNENLYANLDSTSIYDENKEFQGSFAFITNITPRVKAEEELSMARDQAELIMDSDLDEQQRSYLKAISNEADALLGIINDVLAFSKIEAGKLELEEIPFNLFHTIESLA